MGVMPVLFNLRGHVYLGFWLQIFFAEIFRDGLHGEALLNLGQIPIVWLFAVQVFSFVAYTAVGFVLERALSPEYGDTWSCLPFSKSKLAAIEKDNDVKHEPEDFETPDPAWRLVIRISDVWKAFKQSRRNVLMAVKGINLDIYDGQITCILGHNGAGKSTLIGMMTHLLRPTAGKITYTDSVCLLSNNFPSFSTFLPWHLFWIFVPIES